MLDKGLVKIIRGVRLFARNVRNEQLESFSVKSIIEEAIDLCEVKLRMSNVEFQGFFGDSSETVTCRYTEMVQVIMNLISNSCDAIYGLPERWLKIVVESQVEGIFIRFIDSGSGIPEEICIRYSPMALPLNPAGRGWVSD